MKKSLLLFILIVVVAIGACKKSTTASSGKVYTGLVLHSICCQNVIETLSPDTLGADTWIDSNMAPLAVRHHVFRVANPCQFRDHGVYDTIRFRVIPQVAQTCACCLAFSYTPPVSYAIEEVVKK